MYSSEVNLNVNDSPKQWRMIPLSTIVILCFSFSSISTYHRSFVIGFYIGFQFQYILKRKKLGLTFYADVHRDDKQSACLEICFYSLGQILTIRLPSLRESLSRGTLYLIRMWSMLLGKSYWVVISLQSEIALHNEISPQWDTLSNRIPFLRDSLSDGNLMHHD